MASKPKSESIEIVRRFLRGEGVYEISASFREGAGDEWWGQSEKRVEAVLRREMKRLKRLKMHPVAKP